LRKTASNDIENRSLEPSRINWSIGLRILFPIIQKCSNFTILVQVVS
jgi:hypothetical protein